MNDIHVILTMDDLLLLYDTAVQREDLDRAVELANVILTKNDPPLEVDAADA